MLWQEVAVMAWARSWRKAHRMPRHSPGQTAAPGGPKHSELAQALMLFIPTAFDLIATVLMNVGLLSGAVAGCRVQEAQPVVPLCSSCAPHTVCGPAC